ncbi:MAG: aminotransferase class I/II-fold pyridoxal phosphate-dependent enzyme [Acidobacteriota bacterium]|nr:aminotransferase class I/II-fold pyridoxal phosphate-dependent enzyme [Acidobacteriota bacterium]
MKEYKERGEGLAPALGDMTTEDFRRFGHEIVDWIGDYLEKIEEYPVLAQVQPNELISKLPPTPPEEGEDMETILSDVDRLIPRALTHWNHPSFFAYFATSASAPGIFGELLTAAFDVKSMLWRTSPAAIELEQVALDWLRQMMGLDEGLDGIIYDTASVASMHAIAAARERLNLRIREDGMSGRKDLPLLRVYVSEQVHSSIEKGAITLGLGQRAVSKIPTDDEFRMDARALARAIEEDKRNGVVPCCVVATVGTTSTSSIDPVPAIADVCTDQKIWLHVDTAYAGPAAILPEMRNILMGTERADSLVVNPHKWLFTPFDLSVLYCRHMDTLRRAFTFVPEYLKTSDAAAVRNGMDYGIQLGRRFRALKLWMIIRYFGREGLAARIREHCRLAQLFARWVDESPNWERLAPTPFSLVCFRACPTIEGEAEGARAARLDSLNEAIMNNVNATGEMFLSHTRLRDLFTLRLAIGNIRTTEAHVARAWELLNEELARLQGRYGK